MFSTRADRRLYKKSRLPHCFDERDLASKPKSMSELVSQGQDPPGAIENRAFKTQTRARVPNHIFV